MLALLQFHYHNIDVEKLPNGKIMQLFARLEWARKEEAKNNPLTQLFGKK